MSATKGSGQAYRLFEKHAPGPTVGLLIALCLAVAAGLEIFSRYAEDQDLLSSLTVEFFSVAAFGIFGFTVIYGIRRVCSIPRIQWTVITAVLLIIAHQLLNLLSDYGFLGVLPREYGLAPLLSFFQEALWLSGFACLLGGFFFSIFDAQRARDQLIQEHEGLLAQAEERLRVEADLTASEAKYRELVENANSIILRRKPDGTVTFFNEFAQRFFGYTEEEIVGKNVVGTIVPETGSADQDLRAMIEDIGRHPEAYALNENENIRRNGERVWIVWTNKPVYDDDGTLQELLCIGNDITERRRAEAALRDHEELLVSILESTGDGILVGHRDGSFSYANPQFITMFRLPPETMESRERPKLHDAVLQQLSDPEAFLAKLGVLYASKEECLDILEFKDGRVFERYSCPFMRDGVLSGRIWSFRDITERKRTEEALRESEARFQELFDDAPVGYHELDTEGRVVRVNRTELDMLGYTRDEMLGQPVWEFAAEEQDVRKGVIAKMTGTIPPGRTFEREYRRKDGTLLPLLIHDRLLRNEAGQITGIRSTVQDISERKKAEEERRILEAQIRQAQKLESLGILAGGIAHDFNNLLMGILGYADLALSRLSPASPVRDSIMQVKTSAMRAADLTRQMLAYSGKGRFAIEAIDLNEIVKEMTHLLEAAISKKSVLKYDLEKNLPAIEGDATQIRQIVMNLITNASEAVGNESGVIQVSTGTTQVDDSYASKGYLQEKLAEGRYVFFRVADTGSGMDEQTLEKLFDPFFTTKFTGRGLGLSAVLGIVRSHYGAIKVTSEAGRGSTFEVLFPASEQPVATPPPPDTATGSWRGSGTILVVDDEEVVRNVATATLEQAGFTVLTARDGREAIEVFRENVDDIAGVLLDLTIPRMSGEEVFQEMRRIQPSVRVVLSSGYTEEQATQSLEAKGLAGFIQKPYQPIALTAKMCKALQL